MDDQAFSAKRKVKAREAVTYEAEPLTWVTGKKHEAMGTVWAPQILNDEPAPYELRLAMVLIYAFNSTDGRCWLTKRVLAEKMGGVSVETVKKALQGLERRGHISCTRELVDGKEMTVIRPTRGVRALPPFEGASGGKGLTREGVSSLPGRGSGPYPHVSLNDPREDLQTRAVDTGVGTRRPAPDWKEIKPGLWESEDGEQYEEGADGLFEEFIPF